MTIEAPFLSLMPSTVTVYKRQSRDAYGKPSFGTGTSLKCRIQRSSKRALDTDDAGQVQISELGVIYVAGTTDINTEDKLLLPDNTLAVVVSVATVNDENGPHHSVIGFGV